MDERHPFTRYIELREIAWLHKQGLDGAEELGFKVKVIRYSMADHVNSILFDFYVLLTTMCAKMLLYVMAAVQAIRFLPIFTGRHVIEWFTL
jgi:acyl-ACP thioesterase